MFATLEGRDTRFVDYAKVKSVFLNDSFSVELVEFTSTVNTSM